MHIATVLKVKDELLPNLNLLQEELYKKEKTTKTRRDGLAKQQNTDMPLPKIIWE